MKSWVGMSSWSAKSLKSRKAIPEAARPPHRPQLQGKSRCMLSSRFLGPLTPDRRWAMRSTRGGLVTMLAAGALLVLPMSNTRVTRIVSAGRLLELGSEGALQRPRERVLALDRRVRLRPARARDHGQQHHLRRGSPRSSTTYTDSLGVPLDRAGGRRWRSPTGCALGWWDPNARQYTSYTFKSVTSSILRIFRQWQ